VRITWKDNSDNEYGFNIFTNLGEDAFERRNTTSYDWMFDLSPGTKLCVRMNAIAPFDYKANTQRASAMTPWVCATTPSS
jgi:hypothetical protein